MTTVELNLEPLVDQIVDRIVDQVTERLAERLFGPTTVVAGEPPAEVDVPASAAWAAPATGDGRPPRGKDVAHHTCQHCGRQGSRRFTKTPAGWICTETVACRRRAGHNVATPAPLTVVPPTPEPAPLTVVTPTPPPPGVTARCQDCTRTWNLDGRVLDMAVETQELKHSHIVDTYEAAHV